MDYSKQGGVKPGRNMPRQKKTGKVAPTPKQARAELVTRLKEAAAKAQKPR